MKLANTNALYSNDVIAKKVIDYATDHSTGLPKHLVDLHADIANNHPRSQYMISTNQAQCNIFLAHMVGAKRVLEIGTFLGYSALVWAHAVGKDGSVTTLEFSGEYAAVARDNFKKHGVENIQVVEGDALQTLANLSPEEPFDIVFIDAQKSGYPAYLQTLLDKSQGSTDRLVKKGGIIIADNVLRRGLVVDESSDNPWSTTGEKKKEKSEYEQDNDLVKMREFNDAAAKSDRLEVFLMPLYDGVGLSRLLD